MPILLIVLVLFCQNAVAINAQPQSFARATANTLDSGLINNHYTVTGNHFAFLFNDTAGQASFAYSFKLCATGNGCSTNPFSVVLQPHVSMNVNFISSLDVIYPVKGVYTITATSLISGPAVAVIATGNAPANIIDPKDRTIPIPHN